MFYKFKSCQGGPIQFENPIKKYTTKHLNNQTALSHIN